MAVSLRYENRVKMIETETGTLLNATDNTLTWDGLDREFTLNASTTPDIEDCALFVVTLTAGAATVDLTAMAHQAGVTKSATGKKVRVWKFWPATANAGNITVAKGASNGYAPLGTTLAKIIAPDGDSSDYFKAAAGDVGAGAKNLDFSGTGTDSVLVAIGWG